MKRQKSDVFVEKRLETNMLMKKTIDHKIIDHCNYEGHIEVLHIVYVIQNIAYLKKLP